MSPITVGLSAIPSGVPGLGRAERRDLDGAIGDRMPPAGERAHARRRQFEQRARIVGQIIDDAEFVRAAEP